MVAVPTNQSREELGFVDAVLCGLRSSAAPPEECRAVGSLRQRVPLVVPDVIVSGAALLYLTDCHRETLNGEMV